MSDMYRQTPFDECVAHIKKTRMCTEMKGIRPITDLCLECPQASIIDESDPSTWDCRLHTENKHEAYFVPVGKRLMH